MYRQATTESTNSCSVLSVVKLMVDVNSTFSGQYLSAVLDHYSGSHSVSAAVPNPTGCTKASQKILIASDCLYMSRERNNGRRKTSTDPDHSRVARSNDTDWRISD